MPTYDYKCETCGREFEHMQSMSSPHLETCLESECEQTPPGKGKVHRLISGGGGVIYKGDGFYLTDYTKKSGTPAPSPDSTKGNDS